MLSFDGFRPWAEAWAISDLEYIVSIGGFRLEIVPGDEGDLSRWRYEYTFMMTEDMSNHSRPVVSKGSGFTNECEVSGVCNTVGVVTTGHVALVHSGQLFKLA